MIVSGDLNDVQKEMLKNHKFEKMTKIGGNGNEKGYDQAIKMADFN